MKTMYKTSLLLLAAILFAPVALRAQDGEMPAEPSHDGYAPDGVEIHKTTTEVSTNKYQIDLEAYVTGATQKVITEEHLPANILLVLDCSQSMDNTVAVETSYTQLNSQSYTYAGYGNNNYYILYEGEYYPVRRQQIATSSTAHYYLYYTSGSGRTTTTTYLSGTSTTTNQPTNVTSNTATIWTGVLYTKGGTSRNPTYTAQRSTAYSYNSFGTQSLYYRTGSSSRDYQYYQVSRGSEESSSYAYCLSFDDKSGVTHYLSGSEITDVQPTTVTATNTTIWTGVLYRGVSGSASKMSLLKDAVNAFIDIVAADADEYDVNHKISIITYNGSATTRSGLTNNYANLKSIVSNLSTAFYTRSDLGMQNAEDVLKGIPSSDKASRIVLMFTDGQPTNNSSQNFNTTTADNAIKSGYRMVHDYSATVYTVGIFGNLGSDATNVNTYMNYVSSNYPDAQSMTSGGTQKDTKYYQESDGSDLTTIFTTIANETSSGGSAIKLTAETTTVIDVLGVDFRLQPGMKPENVQLFLANPVAIVADMEKPTFKFDTDESKWIPAKTVAPGIEVLVDEENKEIQVGGYDFSKYYVSQVKDEDGNPTGEFTGYKLIIRFPIEIDPNSPGGADVETNQITSGIYVDDEQIAAFNVPHAKIPNLVVIKKGLHKGESATFNISRADWNTGEKASEYDIVLVATCNEEGEDAIAKVKIQVPGRYTVTESTWSWAYDLSSVESSYVYDDKGEIADAQWNAKGYGDKTAGYWATIPTIKGTEADLTKRSITRNVNDFTEDATTYSKHRGTLFIFTNVEKDKNPAHAEAIKNNEFYESRK